MRGVFILVFLQHKDNKLLSICRDLKSLDDFVINNEVFIYRIVEMEKYKLDYYMKNRTAIMDS